MAKSHAFAYRGNIISPPANIAVQGVGVKGGALSDDGTGVWASADGLVSITVPTASTFDSGLTGMFLLQIGNTVYFECTGGLTRSVRSAGASYLFGTLSGVPFPNSGAIIGQRLNSTANNINLMVAGDNGEIYSLFLGAASNGSGMKCSFTYSVPASGTVNPADGKTILVDNDHPEFGSIYSAVLSEELDVTMNPDIPTTMKFHLVRSGNVIMCSSYVDLTASFTFTAAQTNLFSMPTGWARAGTQQMLNVQLRISNVFSLAPAYIRSQEQDVRFQQTQTLSSGDRISLTSVWYS